MTLADFPRHQLTFGPSPIHPVDRLSDHLGGARIWMKREDLLSGLAFGGNKTRKLEYLVPDALAKGADTLVSIGGVQSNHTRQVAAVAAHLGMKAVLVQEHWVDWPDAVNDRVGNILLSRLMGADVGSPRRGSASASRSRGSRRSRMSRQQGHALPDPRRGIRSPARRPRVRELGARGRGAGARTRRVLRHDRRVLGDRSTHAGMIAGFADLEQNFGGRPRRVIGIDASAKIDETRDQVARIARNTASLIGSARSCATTRSPCSRDGPVTTTVSRSSRPTRRCGSPVGSRASSSTPFTKASRWRG